MKPVTCRKGGPQSGGPWFWRKIRRFSGRKQHLGSPASSVMTSHRFPAKSSPLRPRIASILQDFEDMFSKYREHVLLRQIKTNFSVLHLLPGFHQPISLLFLCWVLAYTIVMFSVLQLMLWMKSTHYLSDDNPVIVHISVWIMFSLARATSKSCSQRSCW